VAIRRVPVHFESPSKNPFRLIALLQVQQIAEPELRWGVLSLAKVDRRLESFSCLRLAAQMGFPPSELERAS